jgi:hypothetical protein
MRDFGFNNKKQLKKFQFVMKIFTHLKPPKFVVFVQYPLCSYSGYKIQTLDVKELSLRKL